MKFCDVKKGAGEKSVPFHLEKKSSSYYLDVKNIFVAIHRSFAQGGKIMKKLAVNSEKAPAAIGPYSHANIAGDLVFVSGQLPVKAGKLITDDIGEATRACMENIRLILEAAGSSLDKCLKCTIYLCNLGDFGKVNEVYGSYFTSDYPARVCVEVSALPKGAAVEIAAIACK